MTKHAAMRLSRPHQKSSGNLARSLRFAPAGGHDAHPLAKADGLVSRSASEDDPTAEIRSENPTTTRLAHDFSRVPVHASPLIIQPKLTINTPGDVYEQEAEKISGQVMRAPEAQPQRSGAGGGECSNYQTGNSVSDVQSLQTKPVGSGDAGQIAAPPIFHEVLSSTGRPLDASPRAFMESRFGHDFSRVRVLTDAKAAESTRQVNAVAYTLGNDIAFGAGQYAPETNAGRQLLAHELTHVMQQTVGGHRGVIHRDRDKPEKGTSEEKLVVAKEVTKRQALTDVIKDVSGSMSEKDWNDKRKAAIASADATAATKIYLELYAEVAKLAQADKLVNVFGATGTAINVAKSENDLKPGLNFSFSFEASNGRTSFLDDKDINHKAKLPVTLSGRPKIAILIGPPGLKQSKTAALSTLRHEMMHAENNRSTINWLEKWQTQTKGKVKESDAESKFKDWLTSEKKKAPSSALDLATESAVGGKVSSELLGYTEGFMTSFHLESIPKDEDIAKAEVSSFALLELKTAGDQWAGATEPVRSEALGRIKQYFCDELDQKRRDVFSKWVATKLAQATSTEKVTAGDLANRNALVPIIPFLKNLKSIETASCSKKPAKRP